MEFKRYTPALTNIKDDTFAHCNPSDDGEYLKYSEVINEIEPLIKAMEFFCNSVDKSQIQSIYTYNIFQRFLNVPKAELKKQCSACLRNRLYKYITCSGLRVRPMCKECTNYFKKQKKINDKIKQITTTLKHFMISCDATRKP